MDSLESLDFSSFIIFPDDPWSLLVSFRQLFKLPLVVQCCNVICEWPLSRGGEGGILYRANSANLPSNTERRPAKTELALRNKKDSLFLNYNGRQVFEERKKQKVQQTVSDLNENCFRNFHEQ